jgi:putative ABC transport system substrate-binding protein
MQFGQLQRREFITLLGGAAAAWPLAARAQQAAMPVVGFLATAGADLRVASARAFQLGLRETGFIEGQNVLIEDRAANGRYDRLTAMADELIRKPVSVLVTGGIPATLAAKASGTTISVVFYMGGDPIELGLIHSLSRPGGNFTGVTNLNTELGPKRLELLHGLVPAATSFALLVNPANRNAESQWRDMEAAADALGLQSIWCAPRAKATSMECL